MVYSFQILHIKNEVIRTYNTFLIFKYSGSQQGNGVFSFFFFFYLANGARTNESTHAFMKRARIHKKSRQHTWENGTAYPNIIPWACGRSKIGC